MSAQASERTAAPQLRPLALGEVLDVAMKIVWRNAGTLMRVVVAVVLPVQIISTFIQLSAAPKGWTIQGFPGRFAPPSSQLTLSSSDVRAEVVGVGLSALLSLAAGLLASGACYRAIASAYLGEQTGWRDSLRYALRRLHSILWVTVLTAVIALVALVALVIPGVYLWVSFAVAIPVLLSEDRRGLKALRRSRALVSGFWWRTFGVIVLGAILAGIVSGVLQGLVLGLMSIGAGSGTAVWVVGTIVAGTVAKMVSTPFVAAFVTVLYFDLRVRKEAFDLQLLAGQIGVDPPAGWSAPPEPVRSDTPPFWPPPPGWKPGAPAAPGLQQPPATDVDSPPFWPPPPGWRPGGG